MDRQDVLVKKLQTEFEQFRWGMMKLSKEEIFDKAYEISSKEDIRGFFESEELSPIQIETLLSKDNSLDFMYMCWQKADNYHVEDINDCLKYACGDASEDMEYDDEQDYCDDEEYSDELDDEDDFER